MGHGVTLVKPGAQDQSERSAASTDKLIAKEAPHLVGSIGAVACGQPEAPLKEHSRERKLNLTQCK
ncbi:MAG: hypothetical protein JJ964_12100 [Rhizobiales bacterium]|nr:hypothetical protein [Hyphomicrobiales bacterium]